MPCCCVAKKLSQAQLCIFHSSFFQIKYYDDLPEAGWPGSGEARQPEVGREAQTRRHRRSKAASAVDPIAKNPFGGGTHADGPHRRLRRWLVNKVTAFVVVQFGRGGGGIAVLLLLLLVMLLLLMLLLLLLFDRLAFLLQLLLSTYVEQKEAQQIGEKPNIYKSLVLKRIIINFRSSSASKSLNIGCEKDDVNNQNF